MISQAFAIKLYAAGLLYLCLRNRSDVDFVECSSMPINAHINIGIYTETLRNNSETDSSREISILYVMLSTAI